MATLGATERLEQAQVVAERPCPPLLAAIGVLCLACLLVTQCTYRMGDADTLTDRIVAAAARLAQSRTEVATFRPRSDDRYTVVILPSSTLSGIPANQLGTLGVSSEEARILVRAHEEWPDEVIVGVFAGDHFSLAAYLGNYVEVPGPFVTHKAGGEAVRVGLGRGNDHARVESLQ